MRKRLNTVFLQYVERNPSFKELNGKVSIIAHSLGSVIIHDVLTLWNSYLIKKDRENADAKVAGGERYGIVHEMYATTIDLDELLSAVLLRLISIPFMWAGGREKF